MKIAYVHHDPPQNKVTVYVSSNHDQDAEELDIDSSLAPMPSFSINATAWRSVLRQAREARSAKSLDDMPPLSDQATRALDIATASVGEAVVQAIDDFAQEEDGTE